MILGYNFINSHQVTFFTESWYCSQVERISEKMKNKSWSSIWWDWLLKIDGTDCEWLCYPCNGNIILRKIVFILTHWGRMTHICIGKLIIIVSDTGLSPWWRQAIIWTNAGILLIGPLGTNFSEIIIGIPTFSLKKVRFKMSSGKLRPFCLSLNVLKQGHDLSLGAHIPVPER